MDPDKKNQLHPMHLTGKQKRTLRAKGHHLKATVNVGKQGLTPPMLEHVEDQLLAHELVKVKALKTCPMDPPSLAEAIIQATGAAVAQSIGRTLLLYRPHPEKPVIVFPG